MTDNNNPFALLVEMANQSLSQARGLPAQVEAIPNWSGVGFKLAGQLMIAPMGEVAELLTPPQSLTVLPGVQSWVKGVANVRGRLLPMIDLEAFFGGKLAGSNKARRVLAVEWGDLFTGLLVGEVYGMQHFPVDTFTDQLPDGVEPFAQYLAGAYVHEGKTWTVFSPFKLASDNRFMNAAA